MHIYLNEFQKQELREATEMKRQRDRHEVAMTAQTEDSKDQSLGEALQNGNSKDAKECLIKEPNWTIS